MEGSVEMGKQHFPSFDSLLKSLFNIITKHATCVWTSLYQSKSSSSFPVKERFILFDTRSILEMNDMYLPLNSFSTRISSSGSSMSLCSNKVPTRLLVALDIAFTIGSNIFLNNCRWN